MWLRTVFDGRLGKALPLVHLYEEVDDRIVHAALPKWIDDRSRFAQAVALAAEAAEARSFRGARPVI